jgi:F420H(2)-dependent quinone reductase
VGASFDYRRIGDRLWPVWRRLMGGHTVVYRATHGVVGHRFLGAPPTLLLDHVGAKSGEVRTTPLTYLRDGDDLVLVASKGGYPKNPAWFHNLRAHPDTTVQVGSQRVAVRARVATQAERTRLWPKVVELYGGYATYQARTEREIPLVILEPRTSARARA